MEYNTITKTKQLRKRYKYKKKNCYICGMHKTITELHHVKPLYECKEEFNENGKYNTKLVWLCPNCHRYMHKFFLNKEPLNEKECYELSCWATLEMRDKIIKIIGEK